MLTGSDVFDYDFFHIVILLLSGVISRILDPGGLPRSRLLIITSCKQSVHSQPLTGGRTAETAMRTSGQIHGFW